MQEKTKEICILGGVYFVFGYIFDQMQDLLKLSNTYGFFEFTASCLEKLSNFFDALFIIVFFVILFGKKIVFLQRIIEKYPKISVYFYYIGFVGYIMFALDVLILAPTQFISLSKAVQKYIIWIVSGINIAGVLTAMAFATYDIFFRHKKDEQTE